MYYVKKNLLLTHVCGYGIRDNAFVPEEFPVGECIPAQSTCGLSYEDLEPLVVDNITFGKCCVQGKGKLSNSIQLICLSKQ